MLARPLIAVVSFAVLTTLPACELAEGGPAAPGAVAGDDHAPVFDTRSYADAKAAAEAEKKWFIVKGTATWCGPCKLMDKTTWRDEKVVAWCKEHAIVVALDVDKEKKIAKELRIELMPTMIAFKEGKSEFDRVFGMKSADEFLAWLEGIDKGESSLEAVTKQAGSREPEGGKVDVRARMNLARTLAMKGDYAKATDEYVWLWEHMLEHDQAMVGVRGSFMAGDMERLASKDAGARKRFGELRDATRERLRASKVAWEDVGDFISLNKIVSEENATLAWFDEVKGESRWAPLLRRSLSSLRDVLVEHDRWADIGQLLGNAADDFAQMWSIRMDDRFAPGSMDEATKKQLREYSLRSLRDQAGHDYASLLAAKRDEDAAKLAAKAVELDPHPAMYKGLVGTALLAGVPRPAQVELLKAAEAAHPELAATRKELEEALAKVPSGAK